MLSSLMQSLYSTVDTIIVGQYVGVNGLSAVSVGGNLVHLSAVLCNGIAMSGQILIAQSIGSGQKERIKRYISNLLWALLIGSIIMSTVFIMFRKCILNLLSTPAESYQMAEEYLVICSAGIIFTGLYNMLSAVFRSMGDSQHPFIFILIASAVNVVLDLLFVCLLNWAAAGAALATIIGQAVSVVYCFLFLLRHKKEYHMDFHRCDFKADKATLRLICKLGVPIMLQGSAVNISFLFVSRFVNQLGVDVSAVFGVGQKLWNIPLIMGGAFSQAATAMYGQNLGARKFDRVRQTVRWSLLYNAIVYGAICMFSLLCPQLSFRVFTQDEAILAYSGIWAGAMCIGAIAHVVMGGCNGLIQAVGDTQLSMVIGISDAIFGRVLLSWLLGIALQLGATGFFYGYTAAAFVTAIPAYIYYKFVKWENRGLHEKIHFGEEPE